jgi:hypothetical protein
MRASAVVPLRWDAALLERSLKTSYALVLSNRSTREVGMDTIYLRAALAAIPRVRRIK